MFKKMIFFIFTLFITCNFVFSDIQEWGSIDNNQVGENQNDQIFKILTVDGGGIRGAFTAQLLAMLDEELDFIKYVDFFAGTSSGSINAFALAHGITPAALVDFYQKHAHEIFKKKGFFFELLQLSAKYQTESFKSILQDIFPNNMTLDMLDKKVLCVAFDLFNPVYNNWTPAIIDNFCEETAQETTIVDAILKSTAAPTYFASYQGHIDGAFVANNPSMMALACALDINKGNKDLKNIRLLSFGTGQIANYIANDIDWGIVEWVVKPPFYPSLPGSPLMELLLNASISGPHYQCSSILSNNYLRINPFLSDDIAIDDWSQVDVLIEEAKTIPQSDPEKWTSIINWIKKNILPSD